MRVDERLGMLTPHLVQMRSKPLFQRSQAGRKNRPFPADKHRLGFTLLEVLVALIIFAIAFGAIASIFQTSLRQTTTAEVLFDATALAEHQIARLGNELPLTVGQSSGTSPEGLNWLIVVDLAAPLAEDSNIALYHLTVDVSSKDGGPSHVTLQTLRIGPSP